MRRNIIAGNWKMNMLPDQAMEFISKLAPKVKNKKNEIILCVPYTDLFYTLLTAQQTNIHIGAQNCHYEESGAFTGEIAPQMLKCINVEYVIIGHSERRKYFNETDETVNLKVKSALKHGLKPIICIGETLEERDENKTEEVLIKQITKDLEGLTLEDLSNIIVAYEPIWAIGTGKSEDATDANNTIKTIRSKIKEIFNTEDVSILYGGSVKPENCKNRFLQSDIDGALVGGASLDVNSFLQIIDAQN